MHISSSNRYQFAKMLRSIGVPDNIRGDDYFNHLIADCLKKPTAITELRKWLAINMDESELYVHELIQQSSEEFEQIEKLMARVHYRMAGDRHHQNAVRRNGGRGADALDHDRNSQYMDDIIYRERHVDSYDDQEPL